MQSLLTSTVVATLISTLFAVMQGKKSNNLKYITNERTLWRSEIRTIVEEINESTTVNINRPLSKLKVRINARGMNNDYYDEDSHIWKMIENIERNPVKDFESNKKLLIKYLSIMLKYDWERSKIEVTGEKTEIICIFLQAIAILLYSYYYFLIWKQKVSVYYIGLCGLILLANLITAEFCKWKVKANNNYSSLDNDGKKHKMLKIKLTLINGWLKHIITIVLYSLVYGFFIINNIKYIKVNIDEKYFVFYTISFLMISYFGFSLSKAIKIYYEKMEYHKIIRLVNTK